MVTPPTPRLKAGQGLRGLDPETLERVARHPLQRANIARINELLGWFDSCVSPEDLYEFQRDLYESVFEIETRRGACSQAVKRLRRGQSVQAEVPDLPAGSDATALTTWEFEVFMCERLARQLRCVGDGLAWKAFRYDRRFLMVLSRNDLPGPLVDKEGLSYECGVVDELWQTKKHFGLLNDLTTCIRITDITEFTSDGRWALLHEVKKARKIPVAQKARAQAAVSAIMEGGVLRGAAADNRLVVLSTRFRADMGPLRETIGLAQARLVQGITLPEGRMLFVASLLGSAAHARGTPEQITDLFSRAKRAAIRRAKIGPTTHHLVGNSGDTVARSPLVAPLSIFPLDPANRAELICDLLTFETTLSVDVLAQMLNSRGLQVQVLFPSPDQQVPHDADVLRVQLGSRGMTIHAPAMNSLMFELLRPSAWCDALAESLRLDEPPTHPEVVLRDEASTWRFGDTTGVCRGTV
jgi:hypothetical protein